jgi:hypothetical protein
VSELPISRVRTLAVVSGNVLRTPMAARFVPDSGPRFRVRDYHFNISQLSDVKAPIVSVSLPGVPQVLAATGDRAFVAFEGCCSGTIVPGLPSIVCDENGKIIEKIPAQTDDRPARDCVAVINKTGQVLRRFCERLCDSHEPITDPHAIAAGQGLVFVSGCSRKVNVFQEDGIFLRSFIVSELSDQGEHLPAPSGLAVHGQHLYASDPTSSCVQVLAFNGKLVRTLCPPEFSNGKFVPMGLAVDHRGNVFVSDMKNRRVFVFSSDGHVLISFDALPNAPQPVDPSRWITRKATRPLAGAFISDLDEALLKANEDDGDSSDEDTYNSDLNRQWFSACRFPMCVALDDDGLLYVGGEGENNVQVFAFAVPA